MFKLIAVATFTLALRNNCAGNTARASSSTGRDDHAGPRRLRPWQSADQRRLRHPALRRLWLQSWLLRLWDA